MATVYRITIESPNREEVEHIWGDVLLRHAGSRIGDSTTCSKCGAMFTWLEPIDKPAYVDKTPMVRECLP